MPAAIRRIKQEMLLAATSLARGKTESADSYLKRVTHLHLQNKRIKYIESLEHCTNIKVLYLYDNQIEVIENLNFAKQLSYLYLQNNVISSIPALELSYLTKLYLDDNCIQYVSGLEACVKLEELHLINQKLPSFKSIEFDPVTIDALAPTLQVLAISGNSVTSLGLIARLTNLRKFYANNNMITDLFDIELIVSLQQIEEATFIGNPCATTKKYRDFAIGASSDSLISLDELPILKHQQLAMRGLQVHRRKIGAVMFLKSENADDDEKLNAFEGAYDEGVAPVEPSFLDSQSLGEENN